jgi:hypothetical protein
VLRRRKPKKPGRDFEEAVHRFVSALDPSAKVLFDLSVPDVHTGTARQADVWIVARLLGHFPLTALVSCKDYKRPLDIGHIGAFKSEVDAVGAATGIIYSRSGFTRPAIEKAKALGLTCCRLYRGQPADVPEVLFLTSHLCHTRLQLFVEQWGDVVQTWDELFDLEFRDGDYDVSVLKLLERAYHAGETEAVDRSRPAKTWPEDFERLVEVSSETLRVSARICGNWRRYRGRTEAHFVNGSYCVNDGTFRGGQSIPPVDHVEPPGAGWEEVTGPLVAPKAIGILVILTQPAVGATLRAHFRGRRLREPEPGTRGRT